jgi:hypothetical protein
MVNKSGVSMPTSKQEQVVPSAFELLSRFTRLRESGVNRDDAWYQVCDSVGDMPQVTYKAFLSLAKNWERREGHKYHYRTKEENEITGTRNPVPTTQEIKVPQQPPKPPVRPDDAALTSALDPARLREHEQQRLEQVLDQLDDLPEDGGEAQTPPPETLPPRTSSSPAGRTAPMKYARDYFGPRTILLMHFKTQAKPLRVTIAGQAELFIGRATANAAMSPDIDVNTVNGGEYGVSRMHAAITRRNNQLLICDLESLNFTHVNGMRLLPNEVRVLQDGDEIWFGQLRCQIRFQHG